MNSVHPRHLLFLCLVLCLARTGEATDFGGFLGAPFGCDMAETTVPSETTPIYFGPYLGLTSLVPFVWERSCLKPADGFASASGQGHMELDFLRLAHSGSFSFTLQDNAYFPYLTWAGAYTQLHDFLSVTGGPDQGWIRMRLSFDAAASSSSPRAPVTELYMYVSGADRAPYAVQRAAGILEVEFPFNRGRLLEVRWEIWSILEFPELIQVFGASGHGQFNTAVTLLSAEVLDEEGTVVPEGQVLFSSSSTAWPEPPPSRCRAGGEDSDGDGLCDAWETQGLTVDVAGAQVFLDLPKMGADPNHKDVFVQTDYMVGDGHSHRPKSEAIERVIQAFAEAPVHNPDGVDGITLHVDCGADCVMNPKTGQPWGAFSAAHAREHVAALGTVSAAGYDWSDFDRLKAASFPKARAPVFHYAIFAHDLGGLGTATGISGAPASDFIVSLGSWSGEVGSVPEQQGTFAHELGHNLSLLHGGSEEVFYKPNYLSVMNYLFQTSGLIRDGLEGALDYSRYGRFSRVRLPDLTEDLLYEPAGLGGGSPLSGLGTLHYCPGSIPKFDRPRRVDDAGGPIDWDCSGSYEASSADVNADRSHGILSTFDDWAHLVYDGGSIGALGFAARPAAVTPVVDELTREIDDTIPRRFRVSVVGPGLVDVAPGAPVELVFTVTNQGSEDDTYAVEANSTVSWGDLASVAPSLAVAAGASAQVAIPVQVPSQPAGTGEGRFLVRVASRGNPSIVDRAEAVLYPAVDADLAVTKTGPSSARAGSEVVYTVSVRNDGPDAANGVRVADPTPPGLVFVANSGDCTTAFPCALGGVAVGQTKTIRSRYVIPTAYSGPDAFTNTATADSTGNTTDGNGANDASSVTTTVTPPATGSFFTVTPCRAVDTRHAQGPSGGPALIAGSARSFPVAGLCGVPPGAVAVAANVTVTGPTAAGHLTLHPAGMAAPPVSTINYTPAQTRANNGVFALGAAGDIEVLCTQSSGGTHLVLDVTGYFE